MVKCAYRMVLVATHGRAIENKESSREEVPIAMGASSFFFVQANGGFWVILD